jgi:sulfoxide reductase heme-binding subunit YedZ
MVNRIARLLPIAGFGLLIPWIIEMAAGHTLVMVHYTGWVAACFFILCIAMTPLSIIWNIRSGQKFKKPLGLFAFGYSVLHGIAYLVDQDYNVAAFTENGHIVAGVLAVLIMLPLACTSTPWAMRKMGKNWKRMQRWVYLAAILIAAHIVSPLSFLIVALLAVRLAPVRHYFVQRHRPVTNRRNPVHGS